MTEEGILSQILSVQQILDSLDNESLEEAKKFIHSQINFFEDKFHLRKLLLCLQSFTNSRPSQLPLYLEIIRDISSDLKKFYSSDELFALFQNREVKLLLLELGLIDIKSLIDLDQHNESLHFFFAPEIKKSFPSKKFSIRNFNEYLDTFDINEHIEKRKMLKNPDILAFAIQNDDIDTFLSIISSTNTDLNAKIPDSFFEPYQIINERCMLPTIAEYAAFFGALQIFKYLLMNSVSLDKFKTKLAVAGGNLEIIHFLEEKGHKFDTQCLNTAIEYQRNDIVRYFHDILEVKYDERSLNASITYDNCIFFEDIIKEISDTNPNSFTGIINKMLSIASSCGNLELTNYLCERCNDDSSKYSALNLACQKGFLDIVTFFIVNKHLSVSDSRFSGLFDACKFGHFQTVEFLCGLEGINVNYIYSVSKETPIMIACLYSRLDIVKFLADIPECNLEHSMYNYRTPIFRAVEGQNFDIVKFLADEKHVNLSVIGMGGENLLDIACEKENVEIVKYLVNEKGFDINSSRPLGNAISNNRIEIVKFLVSKNCNLVNHETKWTAVHSAAFYWRYELLPILLDSQKIDINAVANDGVLFFKNS
ncbi:hypothetical protein TRFO_23253 [Tritrichomonas foetus]|uniref:DUF3447 domain-containing protein n=1 Tax=Tritrichomonas foetus TaxID=1144522 RepID=A0A1J4KFX6_9EUKA|nr:hypothetical protein TRFO_23253 [Tritrichomonas foetus]|eukprot:OHT08253.1 hypothetical protein TRFO_23253 [Tritrichomonas foetus]